MNKPQKQVGIQQVWGTVQCFVFLSKRLESSNVKKMMMVGQMVAGLEVGQLTEGMVSRCSFLLVMLLEDMTN